LDFEWERLVSLLDRIKYRTIILLPKEIGQFEIDRMTSKTIQQFAFVKMDWIKQFRLLGTFTVIIFDNARHILWRRSVILKEEDYISVKKVLIYNAKR